MADVRISDLPPGTPQGTDVIPYSNGSTTSKVQIQSLPVSYNSLTDKPSIPLMNPPGTVIMFASNNAPAGYLECNGSAVSRSTYSSLFAVIQTTYGPGDGSTTFNIPDLRGRFIRGWDHGANVDPDRASRTNRGDGVAGDNVGTKQNDTIQNITGGIHIEAGIFQSTASGPFAAVNDGDDGGYWGPGNNPCRLDFNASRSVRTSTETRPTNINLMFCIKT